MQPVTLAIRKAYVQALSGIVYKTKKIPIYEEFVQESPNNKIARVNIGNTEVGVYIILLNQTANDNSAKCRRNDETSIQVQINTVFLIGSGGSQTAEEVATLVMGKLFVGSDLKTSIVMPSPFHLWKSSLESSRNIPYKTENSYNWVHVLLFENMVSQD